MKCTICKKEIELSPSANERAKSTGYSPSYFTKLFSTHAKCAVEKRSQDSIDIIRKLK